MIYTTGTIAINGNTVTGTGTNFSAPLSLIRVGCTLIAIGNPIQIFTVTEIKSGTELSVTPAANPAIPAGTKFSILLSDSISVDGLAQDVAETLRYYQGKESEIATALEWWNEFGGDGQMEQLLADIRAETAKSTANAQKTESDKNAAAASKTAAANSATAAKASQDAAKASETAASNSKTAAATSETNAAKSAADALNYRNQAQAITGSNIGLSSTTRDCPDISGNPSGYIGFLRIMAGATGWPSIAQSESYLSGFICPTLGGNPTFCGLFIGQRFGDAYTYRWSESTGPIWSRHARLDAAGQQWTASQNFVKASFNSSNFSRRLDIETKDTAKTNSTIAFWGSDTRKSVLEYYFSNPDDDTTVGYGFFCQINADDTIKLQVNGAVNCTTLNQSSDRDLKDNIKVIADATESIRKMNGYTYTLKENGLPYAGVIAQEVMEALPEAVGSFTHYGEALQGPTIDGNELREETRYLNVDYAAVTGLLVQVARETDNRVTELEEENASLRANIAAMDERIPKLEALVIQLTGSEK